MRVRSRRTSEQCVREPEGLGPFDFAACAVAHAAPLRVNGLVVCGGSMHASTAIMAVISRDVIARKLGKKEIDVSELGYDKVVATGVLTQPLTITAKKIVGKAKEKIENSGGKAIENV